MRSPRGWGWCHGVVEQEPTSGGIQEGHDSEYLIGTCGRASVFRVTSHRKLHLHIPALCATPLLVDEHGAVQCGGMSVVGTCHMVWGEGCRDGLRWYTNTSLGSWVYLLYLNRRNSIQEFCKISASHFTRPHFTIPRNNSFPFGSWHFPFPSAYFPFSLPSLCLFSFPAPIALPPSPATDWISHAIGSHDVEETGQHDAEETAQATPAPLGRNRIPQGT